MVLRNVSNKSETQPSTGKIPSADLGGAFWTTLIDTYWWGCNGPGSIQKIKQDSMAIPPRMWGLCDPGTPRVSYDSEESALGNEMKVCSSDRVGIG